MINSTLCYIRKGDCYLMLHRVKKENDLNEGKWIGVGGKLLENESPEEGVIRETLEETGLTLHCPKYRAVITFVSDRWPGEYMHLFTADDFSGELTECDEGDLEWVERAQVEALTLWQGDKIFLRLLREDAPFFSLKLEYKGDTLVRAALDGEALDV